MPFGSPGAAFCWFDEAAPPSAGDGHFPGDSWKRERPSRRLRSANFSRKRGYDRRDFGYWGFILARVGTQGAPRSASPFGCEGSQVLPEALPTRPMPGGFRCSGLADWPLITTKSWRRRWGRFGERLGGSDEGPHRAPSTSPGRTDCRTRRWRASDGLRPGRTWVARWAEHR